MGQVDEWGVDDDEHIGFPKSELLTLDGSTFAACGVHFAIDIRMPNDNSSSSRSIPSPGNLAVWHRCDCSTRD